MELIIFEENRVGGERRYRSGTPPGPRVLKAANNLSQPRIAMYDILKRYKELEALSMESHVQSSRVISGTGKTHN